MILALKNGALIPPSSLVDGHKRKLALTVEAARIEMQLRDKSRRQAFIDGKIPGDYDKWKRSAESALRMHNLEVRLLREWLDEQTVQLLQRVAKFHVDLVEDETELSGDERSLVDEVAAYVRAREV